MTSVARAAYLAVTAIIGLASGGLAQSAADALGFEYIRTADKVGLHRHKLEFLKQHPDSPFAIFVLRSLMDLRTDVPEPELEGEAVLAALSNPKCDPFFAAALREHRVHYDNASGEPDRARTLAPEAGCIAGWRAAGPFGTDATLSIDVPYAPEITLDAPARDRLKREVRWRRVPADQPGGQVNPSSAIEPPRGGVVYSLAQVHADEEQDAVAIVRSANSIRVFWNGRRVFEVDPQFRRAGSEHAVSVRLVRGWNRVLVKSHDGGSGDAAFEFLLLGSDGRAVRGLKVEHGETIHPLSVFLEPASPAPVLPHERLRGLVAKSDASGDAAAVILAAWAFEDRLMEPVAYDLIERIADSTDSNIRLHYAEVVHRNYFWPDADRLGRARRILEDIVAGDPAHVGAQVFLAYLDEQRDKFEDALKRLDETRARVGDSAVLFDRIAETYGALRWRAEEQRAFEQLHALAPWHVRTQENLRAIAERMGDTAREEQLNRLVEANPFYRGAVAGREFQIALESGDHAAAERALVKLDALDAGASSRRDRRIRYLASQARSGSGESIVQLKELVDAALAEDPFNDDYPALMAAIFDEAGREAEALPYHELVLRISPGAAEHRRRTGRHHAAEKYFDEFRVDAAVLRREVDELMDTEYRGASSVYALDHLVTVADADGWLSRETHTLIRVGDKNAIERHGTQRAPQDGLLEAAVHLPNGTTLEGLTGGGGLTMPGLTSGAYVEMRYRDGWSIAHNPAAKLGGFFFQDRQLDAGAPFHLTRWIIVLPKDSHLRLDLDRFDGEHKVDDRGAVVVHTLEKRRVPPLKPEPFMPDAEDLIARAECGGEENWAAKINHEYRNHAAWWSRTTPLVERTAATIVESSASDDEKARRIYEWVMEEIKSEDGGSLADRTLFSKSGDRTVLLAALFAAARVPFDLVMVMNVEDPTRPVRWHEVTPDDFGVPLLRVRAAGQPAAWIRGDLRFRRYGAPIDGLEGAPAWVVEPGGGYLTAVPKEQSSFNETRMTFAIMDRGAQVECLLRLPGDSGAGFKEYLGRANATDRRAVVEQVASGLFPGMSPKLASHDFQGLSSRAEDLGILITADVSRVLTVRSGVTSLKQLLVPLALRQNLLGGSPVRHHPFIVPRIPPARESFRIVLPDNLRVSSLPVDKVLVEPYGSYSLRYRLSDDGVVIERAYAIAPVRVAPREYAKFVKFCRDIDDAEDERILLDEIGRARDR